MIGLYASGPGGVKHWRVVEIERESLFRDTEYHGAGDVFGRLDYDFAANVSRATLATVLEVVGIVPD